MTFCEDGNVLFLQCLTWQPLTTCGYWVLKMWLVQQIEYSTLFHFYLTFFFFFFFLFFFVFFFFLAHTHGMEVSRLDVKLELHLLAHATAIAIPDMSHVFNLHHSSLQHQIFNPLSKARDGTHILMDTSCVCYC